MKQRLDFVSQGYVLSARLVQKGSALAGILFERGPEQIFNSLPFFLCFHRRLS